MTNPEPFNDYNAPLRRRDAERFETLKCHQRLNLALTIGAIVVALCWMIL